MTLMALDFNAQLGHSGSPLPHFPPLLTPDSTEVSVFAQDTDVPLRERYVFPPLLGFLDATLFPLTPLAPRVNPLPY